MYNNKRNYHCLSVAEKCVLKTQHVSGGDEGKPINAKGIELIWIGRNQMLQEVIILEEEEILS